APDLLAEEPVQHRQHRERLEERPEKAQHGPLVAQLEGGERELVGDEPVVVRRLASWHAVPAHGGRRQGALITAVPGQNQANTVAGSRLSARARRRRPARRALTAAAGRSRRRPGARPRGPWSREPSPEP